jgi:toxin ParE1/3/4
MDFELTIHPEARVDLLNAFNWYQKQRPGLGFDFKLCIEEVFSRIQKRPTIYKKAYTGH